MGKTNATWTTTYPYYFVDLKVLERWIQGHPKDEAQQHWVEDGERMTMQSGKQLINNQMNRSAFMQ